MAVSPEEAVHTQCTRLKWAALRLVAASPYSGRVAGLATVYFYNFRGWLRRRQLIRPKSAAPSSRVTAGKRWSLSPCNRLALAPRRERIA